MLASFADVARRRGPDHRAGAAAPPGSRSRPAWCRSRSGCRAGTAAAPGSRPGDHGRGCASTSRSTACGARWPCSAGRPAWLVGALLVLGAADGTARHRARGGAEPGLSRVIAYSSVENTGLIVTGFGIALTGAAVGDRAPGRGRLLAATLQIVAHTVAKSLLFTSAAGIEAAAGSDDLEELHGLQRPGFGCAAPTRAGGRGAPAERRRLHGPGRGLADAGRAAAHGRLRVRMVPARGPDAAVPRPRPRLPPGARPGRRRGRAHLRLRRRHLRPAGWPDRPGPRPSPASPSRPPVPATAGPGGGRCSCSRWAASRSRR